MSDRPEDVAGGEAAAIGAARDGGASGGGVVDASEEEARRELARRQRPVVVDFHATWCGPCRWLEPVLEELSGEFGDSVTFLKVDVDEAPALAGELRIASVPTVVFFRDGEEVGRSLGLEPARLRVMLEEVTELRGAPEGATLHGSPEERE
ncbi:MAG: thioredoxin [Gemmatimonadota bacterium]